MPDNKRKLYDALSGIWDLGTFESFSQDIEDENKRRKLYEAASKEFDLGDFDSFSGQLGFTKQPEQPVADQTQVARMEAPDSAPVQKDTVVQPVVQSPVVEDAPEDLNFDDEPQGPAREPEKIRGFFPALGQGAKNMYYGLVNLAGEAAQLFSGRNIFNPLSWGSRNAQEALDELEHRLQAGVDPHTHAEPEYQQMVAALNNPDLTKKFKPQTLSSYYNASVTDIFEQEYLSPRPQTTTLQIPTQGIGEWCHPTLTAVINDSVFRSFITREQVTIAGVPFQSPREGRNIVFTSLWDNYPDSIVIPLKGKAESAYLLMAGSTNHMQSRIDNALLIATYTDHTTDTLHLRNPDNWCPIEQDYYVDGKAFYTTEPRPFRVCLGQATSDGQLMVSRDLGKTLGIREVYGRAIPGGGAQLLRMPLNPRKRLRSLTLRTLSNDIVVGLMGLTLQ